MESVEDLVGWRFADKHCMSYTVYSLGGPVDFSLGMNEAVEFIGQAAIFDGNRADFDNPVTVSWR